MAKKTLKEKRLADLRKEKKLNFASYSFVASGVKIQKSQQIDDQAILLKKDLLKTIMLGASIFTIEIMLFIFSKRLGW